jgi:hypothetical protein
MSPLAQWRKSSYSPNEQNCVELAAVCGGSGYVPEQSDWVEAATARMRDGS